MPSRAVVPPGHPIDPASAGGLLANWGFLAEPDLPDRPGPAWLLVAIRRVPTLRHFDPELVEFWVSEQDRGRHATITYETPMPLNRPFSWGLIRTVDRLKVSNEYLTFGGTLVADRSRMRSSRSSRHLRRSSGAAVTPGAGPARRMARRVLRSPARGGRLRTGLRGACRGRGAPRSLRRIRRRLHGPLPGEHLPAPGPARHVGTVRVGGTSASARASRSFGGGDQLLAASRLAA